ncbi:MAG: hypothetical protein ABMB14_19410, partial [Myxococcota bacterium]
MAPAVVRRRTAVVVDDDSAARAPESEPEVYADSADDRGPESAQVEAAPSASRDEHPAEPSREPASSPEVRAEAAGGQAESAAPAR